MPKSYLVINNVAKRNNARDLCLTGFAHQSTVLLTGFHVEGLSHDEFPHLKALMHITSLNDRVAS